MSVVSDNNTSPVSSCMYSTYWTQKDLQTQNSWFLREEDDFYSTHITAPVQADASRYTKNETVKEVSRPLREKNCRKNIGYKHVPHKDKPPQVVAKRNARERRRVQAVNTAFMRLRKAVPIENTRGKRISKVKTLQNAIEYIHRLQQLLEHDGNYRHPLHVTSNYRYASSNQDVFDDVCCFEDDDEL